jgi:hypothetical protein
MASVSQPGSRAGLITALVVFIILFFIAAIFAVVKGIDDADKEKRLAELQKKYRVAISDQELQGPEFQALVDLRNSGDDRSRTIFDLLLEQRSTLANVITGRNVDAKAAKDTAKDVVDRANVRLQPTGVTAPGGSLAAAVNVLADALVQRHQQLVELDAKVAAAGAEIKKQVDIYQAQLGEHRKALEAAKTETAEALKVSTTYRQTTDDQIARLTKEHVDAINKTQQELEQLKQQVQAKEEELAKLAKEQKRAIDMLARFRPGNTADAMVRQADGQIVQVARKNVVYINLGAGQQIAPGMTFEVYDKNEGVPRLAENEDSLPVGKGSIEVVRVGAGSSECRVVKIVAGEQFMEGDLIANLVYNPSAKLRFKVYGEFDIDQNGVATAQEAEIVKRLVAQWGGQLTDEVSVATDFVVLGREPRIPEYSADQLRDDPIRQLEVDNALKALNDWEEVRNNALSLHIPVLNQNRFLYYIGFYDLARK